MNRQNPPERTGREGFDGGERGDLYLKVRILPHRTYKILGSDLKLKLPCDLNRQSGRRVTVPTLDGPVLMRVPAGTCRQAPALERKGLPYRGTAVINTC